MKFIVEANVKDVVDRCYRNIVKYIEADTSTIAYTQMCDEILKNQRYVLEFACVHLPSDIFSEAVI